MTGNRKSNQWLIDLSKENIWAEQINSIPSMICYSYNQLKSLAEDGQVYGVMLQCKDLYESLYKIPLIMAMIVIENDPAYKEKQDYTDVIRLALEKPMSMGRWNELAEKFISKKNKTVILPDTLTKILKSTHDLYEEEVSSSHTDIVNWRNNSVGHGALRFENDPAYQEEIQNLLIHLKNYFDDDSSSGVSQLYQSAYFFAGEIRLCGDCQYKAEYHGTIQLFVDHISYKISNFISDENLRLFLFDSFYSKQKLIKYNSYIDGQDDFRSNKFFTDLYDKFVLKGMKDFGVNTGMITREQEQILELLNMPAKYIKPIKLVKILEEQLDEHERGIISMFMERGTGKSAFANRMSGLFNSQSLIKKSFSRCYHVQNAALRGINDFINALNFNFKHSYDHNQDLYGNTDELLSLSLEEKHPDKALAAFLNYYHKHYGKEYTILLIDGIDEITEPAKAIMDFMPTRDLLDEGVFIILLSRFKDEHTVQGSSRKYIEKAENVSDAIIKVRRKDEPNMDVLKTCIDEWKKEQEDRETISTEELIEKADYRFLYLKAYLELPSDVLLDKTDETHFVKSYLEYITSFYGTNQKRKFQELAVTIALFPQITLKQYQEYMGCQDLKFEFVGILNDLMPLLSINHINGEDAYEFADLAYAEYVLSEYSPAVWSMLDYFQTSHKTHYEKIFQNINTRSSRRQNIFDPKWNDINDTIIFFTEGMLTIHNLTKRIPLISKWFYTYCNLVPLFEFLCENPWGGRHGYGNHLIKALFNAIADSMVFCLHNQNLQECKQWLKRTNNLNTSKEKHHNPLQGHMRDAPQARQMLEYVLSHPDELNLSDWLWLFEQNYSARIDQFLVQHSLMEEFINSIIPDYPLKPEFYFELITNGSLSAEQEEKIYNYLLITLLSSRTYDTEPEMERIKGCLHEMKEKGYNVNTAAIPRYKNIFTQLTDIMDQLETLDLDTLIQNAEAGDIYAKRKQQTIQDAIDYLLDFPYFMNDPSKSDPAFKAYIMIKYEKNGLCDPKQIQQLHSAFYQRLYYEKEHKRFAEFLEKSILLDDFIVEILKNEHPNSNQWFDELLQWIDWIEPYADEKHKHIIDLLSRMYIEAIHWLDQEHKDKQATEMKQRYIYNWDTRAFFTFETRNFKGLSIIYKDGHLIYCCNNVLTLLKEYYYQGKQKEFQKLMSIVESSIPIIDKALPRNENIIRLCEIVKCRFMILRKELQYKNNFDSYLSSIVENHKSYIKNILSSLSKSTEFSALGFHISQLLECTWQTQDWNCCIELCQELLNALSQAEFAADETIKSLLDDEIKALNNYKTFFLYLSNQKEKKDHEQQTIHLVEFSSVAYYHGQLEHELGWFLHYIADKPKEEQVQYSYVFETGYITYGY